MLQPMNTLWQALSLWVFGREDVVSALESVQSQLNLASPNKGEITYTPQPATAHYEADPACAEDDSALSTQSILPDSVAS